MEKSTFQFPSGRKYKNQNRPRRDNRDNRDSGDRDEQSRRHQGRTSNRRLMTILMRRYEQMVRRRFGDDVDQKVNLKQLLLDCFHYDLNLLMELNIPYTHLDELVQTEPSREERRQQRENDGVEEINGVVGAEEQEN